MTGLAGPRKPRWTVDLLDRNHYTIRALDGVLDHSVDLASTERLGGSASLVLDADAVGDVDWLSARVRFTYDPGVVGVDPWPLGVFLVASPSEEFRGRQHTLTVGCLHLPVVVDRFHFTKPVHVAKGTRIVPWVVNRLVNDVGVPRHLVAATDLGTVTASDRTYDPKDSALTIINDLLTKSGYWSLRADTTGVLVVAPWDAPADRAPVFTFEKGEAGLTRPEWTRTQDLSSVPNRVVAATSGSEDEEALVGVAELTDPKDPFSIANRGVVSRFYDIEAVDQKSADTQAKALLVGALSPVLGVEVEHAVVPVAPNDVVEYELEDGSLGRFTVQRMSVGSGFDAHVSAVWRGVTGNEVQQIDGTDI